MNNNHGIEVPLNPAALRASLKARGDYTPAEIEAIDRQFVMAGEAPAWWVEMMDDATLLAGGTDPLDELDHRLSEIDADSAAVEEGFRRERIALVEAAIPFAGGNPRGPSGLPRISPAPARRTRMCRLMPADDH